MEQSPDRILIDLHLSWPDCFKLLFDLGSSSITDHVNPRHTSTSEGTSHSLAVDNCQTIHIISNAIEDFHRLTYCIFVGDSKAEQS